MAETPVRFDDPLPSDTEGRRSWIMGKCAEIQRWHAEAARREMKPYIDMLMCLPAPPLIVDEQTLSLLTKEKK